MDISEQAFLELHQVSRTLRGQMVHADPGRHLFDTSMFRIVWGPAVHAMCSIVEQVGFSVYVCVGGGGYAVIIGVHHLSTVVSRACH